MNYEKDWWREQCPEDEWRVYEDFRYFLYVVWKHLQLPDPTPVQYDIASFIQHGPRRKVIEAFRGVGKSWITSAYVCWLLLRNPQLKIMVVSASKERADQFSTFTLRLINEIPLLMHLVPRADQRQSKISFDVGPAQPDHSPSVKSVGIFGQLTGSRADIIISDDAEVPNNSETQGMRDKLSERVKEFDAVLKPGGYITYLGTPQCEDSLYNQLPERGYVVRVWPARIPKTEEYTITYGDTLAPYILERLSEETEGDPVDPNRFDREDLLEREASYGRSGFALQFMLDTRLSDADRYPLKLSDLVIMRVNNEAAPEKIIWSGNPDNMINTLECVGMSGDRYYAPAAVLGEWLDYQGACIYIDPSGRGKDETAFAVVKMLNGYLHCIDAGGFPGGYTPETLEALADLIEKYKCTMCMIESNFGDGMFTELFKPYVIKRKLNCAIEEVRTNQQKEKRIIDTLEPVMNQHRLIIDHDLIERDRRSTERLPPEIAIRYQLFYQMSRITKERGALSHDDRLDALAGAVKYWVDQMAMDADRKMSEREARQAQEEFDIITGKIPMTLEGIFLGTTVEQSRKVRRNRRSCNSLINNMF